MIIQIPQPCEQPWEGMEQRGKDCRFCASCQKTVTDFTGWTDNDIYHFYTKHPDACGQFTVSQLERELLPYYPPPQRGWSFRGWALTASLLFAVAPFAWSNPQGVEMVVDAEQKSGDGLGSMRGRILDEKGYGVVGAIIQLSEAGIVKSGAAVYEDDGRFTISPIKPGMYRIKVSYVGYKDSGYDVVVKDEVLDIGSVTITPLPYDTNDFKIIRMGGVPLVDKYQPGINNIQLTNEYKANTNSLKSSDQYKPPADMKKNIRGKMHRKP